MVNPSNRLLPEETECYHAEYATWHNMKRRCYNVKAKNYPYYGGKGVTVSEDWLDSFATFFHDMGRRPEGTSLDRIDPYGNYSKDNCRWADQETQNSNRRYRDSTKLYTSNGVTQSVKAWSEQTGIRQDTLRHRMRRKLPDCEVFYPGRLSDYRQKGQTQL